MRILICEDSALLREGLVRAARGRRPRRGRGRFPDASSARRGGRRDVRPTSASSTCVCRRPGPTRASAPRSRLRARRPRARRARAVAVRRGALRRRPRHRRTAGRSATCSRTASPTWRSSSRRSTASARARRCSIRRSSRSCSVARTRDERMLRLTDRESAVLALIAEGRSNQAIAQTAPRHGGQRREAHHRRLPEARPRARRIRQPASARRPRPPRTWRPTAAGRNEPMTDASLPRPVPRRPRARRRPHRPSAPRARHLDRPDRGRRRRPARRDRLGRASRRSAAASASARPRRTVECRGSTRARRRRLGRIARRSSSPTSSEAELEVTSAWGIDPLDVRARRATSSNVASPRGSSASAGWLFGGTGDAVLRLPGVRSTGPRTPICSLSAGDLRADGEFGDARSRCERRTRRSSWDPPRELRGRSSAPGRADLDLADVRRDAVDQRSAPGR